MAYYETLYDELLSRGFEDLEIDDRADGQWDFVESYLPGRRGLRILEVGGADALASRRIRDRVPDATLDVVEPSERWLPYYARHGIRRVAAFFPFDSPDRYDYIHMSHTLEHLIDLTGALNALRERLVDHGLLFVEVPNCTEEYWSEDTFDPDGHIHYFTADSLARFAVAAGFDVVRTITAGMTHRERNRFYKEGDRFAREIVERCTRSIRENEPQPEGEYLRALFRRR